MLHCHSLLAASKRKKQRKREGGRKGRGRERRGGGLGRVFPCKAYSNTVATGATYFAYAKHGHMLLISGSLDIFS